MFFINQPSLDWLTLTTFENHWYNYWTNALFTHSELVDSNNDATLFNKRYAGTQVTRPAGSVFLGEGNQKNTAHYLLNLTSHLAQSNFPTAVLKEGKNPLDGDLNCTRIDIQCTVPHPDGWSQVDLFTRLDSAGHLAQTRASRTKEREYRTVYVGADGSDRYIRIYQKPDDAGNLFLRFEVQYRNNKRGGLAWQAFKRIVRGGEQAKRELLHLELIDLGDSHLTDVFGPPIASPTEDPLRLKRDYSRSISTRNWFMTQVLVALGRYVDEYPLDTELRDAFYKVLAGDEEHLD